MRTDSQADSLMNLRSLQQISATSWDGEVKPGFTFSPETTKEQDNTHEARVLKILMPMVTGPGA